MHHLDRIRHGGANGGLAEAAAIDWENGQSFYHPFDGLAMEKHADWVQKYPMKLWSREFTLGRWLEEFHELLNCDEYRGI